MEKKSKLKKIKVTKNGPYLISGNIPLVREVMVTGEEGDPAAWEKSEEFPEAEDYRLCRCGRAKNKPFCDDMHIISRFNGEETASRETFEEQAEEIVGPELILKDAPSLCAAARFCHRASGIWRLTEKSDQKEARDIAIQEAADCPSGRLVVCDKKTKKAIEPEFSQEISVTEDVPASVSGPLWVKGGIPIESSDGKRYEIRNRVTLCRCGVSKNKPFCDGTHIDIGFSDEE
jgi:CDGSH-type Zn-finger protein